MKATVYLGSPTRTPIGKFGGSLKRFSAPELAALALNEAMRRAESKGASPLPEFVFLGHARQAGAGPNPARQSLVFAGLPETIPAVTLNQACASGMTAIFSAIEKIKGGRAQNIWAGGVESMSNTPYLLPSARFGYRMGNNEVVDGMWKDGFFCHLAKMVMGETVETFLAKELQISRAEQDAYALCSQQKADQAWKAGLFNEEVFEIPGEQKGSKILPPLKEDEHRRGETTAAELAKLPPVFDPKTGSITAGNSSGITDGAAWMRVSAERGSDTLAEVLDYETVAIDPKRMGIAPVPAVQSILKRNRLETKNLAAVELNEAFAAQVIACQRQLQIPDNILNSRGGAIALGHPIGASGARIVVTLLHRLKGQTGALGLATACVSGGQGVALLIKIV